VVGISIFAKIVRESSTLCGNFSAAGASNLHQAECLKLEENNIWAGKKYRCMM